jgi:hypothetical protein
MKRFLLLIFLFSSQITFGQILTFDFAGLAGSEVTANSNSNDANLSSSTISRGAGVNASNNGGRFNSNSWTTAGSINTSDYIEFTVTPINSAQFDITSIDINHQRSGSGPKAFALRSSTDNYSADLGTFTISDVTSTQSNSFSSLSITNQATALTFRIYAYNAEGGPGTWGPGDFSGNDIIVNGSVTTSVNPEPDNHPTNFLAATGSPSTSVIDLIWDDATGTNLPDGYLIIANTSGTFTDPVDGTDPAEDTDLSDGSASIEVAQGVQSASFTGLSASTQYFFKIFPYANTGSNIDFKTDGTPQTANATTDAACGITALGSETISCTSNTSGSNNDFVTISIPYTGVDANAVLTILVDGSGETNNGNNPTSFSNGTISFDAYEGAAWSVTITGGTCNLSTSGTVNSNECDLLPTAFINEFHYDNIGSDVNEFVEIALISSFAGALSDFQVTLYNGNGGASYDTETLNNLTVGNTTDGFTFYTWDVELQNGDDGIALSYQGILIEFISYEGSFTATNGDANGQTSTDVGVAESNSTTTSAQSIQRTGNCNGDACPVGLSWTGPSTATAGAKNTSQNLPIELTYFQAQKIKQQVLLSWETAIEINNDYMAIERSKDGRTFQEMSSIQGAGTTNTPQRYTYLDENPFTGTNYYRLRQVDFDGRATYHEVVVVNMASANQIRILPNPVNDFTTLQLTEVLETEGQVLIYDMMGKVAFETRLAAGQSNVEIDLSFLANGSYIIRLELADGVVTERFVKQ